MTPYTHTTLSDAMAALGARLINPLYYTQPELQFSIIQAIRMWQAATTVYRERATFNTSINTPFYDLTVQIPTPIPPVGGGTTSRGLGLNVTDQDLFSEIAYHLLEPSSRTGWIGSAQFTQDTVLKSLQRSRNQFLSDTAAVQSAFSIIGPNPPTSRISLPDKTIDIRRIAWIDTPGGLHYQIFRDDDFSATSFNPGWPQNPGIPQIYSSAVSPPTTIEVIPGPLNVGTLELVTVQNGPDLTLAGGGVVLGIPDDFAWAVKYGALAILFALDGTTLDPARAQYCRSLYQIGVELAKINPSVLMVRINDELIYTGSIFDMDTYMPGWEDKPGAPIYSAMSGRNILAVGPIADAVGYGVTVDYVPNAPIPIQLGDFIQIGRESLDAVLGMAQCICAFKQGGDEFMSTIPYQKEFLRIAAVQNSKLAANAIYQKSMEENALLQNKTVPIMSGENANG
jgi:hypothetical protein